MKYYQNYKIVQTYSDCGLVTAQHNESLAWLVMYGDRILKSFRTKREADDLASAIVCSGLVMMPGYLYNVTLLGATVSDRVDYLRSIS
jgi:hypothetical protein